MISLADQIAEVQREIALRRNVYPKLSATGKLKDAILHMERIEAVLSTLRWLQQNERVIKAKVEVSSGDI